MSPIIKLTDEVRVALADGIPVVALESTIISHGMPFPQNVEMAAQVEQIIRDRGAVPATIAILDGIPRIGLSASELEMLGSASDVAKVSTRDIAVICARKAHGATTVASTMAFAGAAGIATFVTGGIGGVHRGASSSYDVSADLTELGRTNVAVISAGVKSILDIGLTLEMLETLSVPVLVNGSDQFPSFYSRESGFAAPVKVGSAKEVAEIMRIKWSLGLNGGVSIANPIPSDDEIPASEISKIIDQALAESDANGIKGKDVTPLLLKRIAEITGGESLRANIALVKNNASFGADIAVEYARLLRAN